MLKKNNYYSWPLLIYPQLTRRKRKERNQKWEGERRKARAWETRKVKADECLDLDPHALLPWSQKWSPSTCWDPILPSSHPSSKIKTKSGSLTTWAAAHWVSIHSQSYSVLLARPHLRFPQVSSVYAWFLTRSFSACLPLFKLSGGSGWELKWAPGGAKFAPQEPAASSLLSSATPLLGWTPPLYDFFASLHSCSHFYSCPVLELVTWECRSLRAYSHC